MTRRIKKKNDTENKKEIRVTESEKESDQERE